MKSEPQSFDFNKLVNWKLLEGSHVFPGESGGTCINEAAIVAAGFEYSEVHNWSDCPPCFSPVLSALLISINDSCDDNERQQLLPFVFQIAGTYQGYEAEKARLQLVHSIISKRIFWDVPPAVSLSEHGQTILAYHASYKKVMALLPELMTIWESGLIYHNDGPHYSFSVDGQGVVFHKPMSMLFTDYIVNAAYYIISTSGPITTFGNVICELGIRGVTFEKRLDIIRQLIAIAPPKTAVDPVCGIQRLEQAKSQSENRIKETV